MNRWGLKYSTSQFTSFTFSSCSAEVSMYCMPHEDALVVASSLETLRWSVRSLLLPTRMMGIPPPGPEAPSPSPTSLISFTLKMASLKIESKLIYSTVIKKSSPCDVLSQSKLFIWSHFQF